VSFEMPSAAAASVIVNVTRGTSGRRERCG
jgi:hypothetical protein